MDDISLIESIIGLDVRLQASKQRNKEVLNFNKKFIDPIERDDINLVDFVLSDQSPETFFEDQIVDMDWNPVLSVWESIT